MCVFTGVYRFEAMWDRVKFFLTLSPKRKKRGVSWARTPPHTLPRLPQAETRPAKLEPPPRGKCKPGPGRGFHKYIRKLNAAERWAKHIDTRPV